MDLDHEQVKAVIRDFFEKMGITFDRIEVVATPAHPMFMVHSSDSGILIGTGGENLRAMNILLKKVIEKKLGSEHTKFILDINNYHKRQIDELEKTVRVSADRVKLFKAEVPLAPMSSYERMIVHALFNEDKEITTESRGEGRDRHIVLKLKEEAPTAL